MGTAKIIDKREIPATEPERIGKKDIIVTYQVSPLQTYFVIIKEEEFSDEELRRRIAEEMAEREAWVGKEIEF